MAIKLVSQSAVRAEPVETGLGSRFDKRRANGMWVRLWSMFLLLPLLSPAFLQARVTFTDILDAPKSFFDTAEKTLWEMLDELQLRDHVEDLVVGGSMAFGIARLEDDPHPSDIDFIVYLKGWYDLPPQKQEEIGQVRHEYARLLKKRLQCQLKVDILVVPADVLDRDNPNMVWYSLTERKIYHRPDNQRRQLYGVLMEGVYYAFDRTDYNRFRQQLSLRKHTLIQWEVEGDQLAAYLMPVLKGGPKTLMIRSLPKR